MNDSYNSSLYYTLNQTCEILRISSATVRNWLKSGRLQAAAFDGTKALFDKTEIESLKNKLQNGTDKALKSRRNKLYKANHELYAACLKKDSPNASALSKLLSLLKDKPITNRQISCYIAETALRLYYQAQSISYQSTQSQFMLWITNIHKKKIFDRLLLDLIEEKTLAADCFKQCPESFTIDFIYDETEDILGLLYLSLKNCSSRKANGAYYTPPALAASLMQRLFCPQHETQAPNSAIMNSEDFTILDPSCGTGSFLLNLPPHIPFSSIYGMDLDSMSIQILRLNFYLRQPQLTYQELCAHFFCQDFLLHPPSRQFDYIVGNPPWGSHYDSAYKKKLRAFICNKNGKADSFALFLEQGVHLLKENGTLLFLMPETFLHIKSHYAIRKLILEQGTLTNVQKLQHAFLQVQSPVIALQFQKTKPVKSSAALDAVSAKGIQITLPEQSFIIQQERPLNAEFMPLFMTDKAYQRLERFCHAKNCVTLKGQADFALGIVTGNNALHLKQAPTPEAEPILKGRDVTPFQIAPASSFMEFKPETLQQYAPLSIYHAPEKLIYRFIGSKLMFAYDNQQLLTLNSCNIIIPHIDGLHIKYILAVLNSSAAQFIFQYRFHSLKVLRSHLEQLPIPLADMQTQQTLIALAEELEICKEQEKFENLYKELDEIVIGLYE